MKSGEVFFLTLCGTPRGANQLANERTFPILRGAFEHNAERHVLWTHLLLAMPDHLHALVAFPPPQRMDAVIRALKRFLAKTAGITWQDGFFDHRLRNHERFEEKARYIRMNPVRAGLVDAAEKWPYFWPATETPSAR